MNRLNQRLFLWAISFVFLFTFAGAPDAEAKKSPNRIAAHKTLKKTESRYSALVLDADTGQVLHEENADAYRYPASLTKMMTLYLTFEALRKGTWTMDTRLSVSDKAARMPQTNISLKPGDTISVRDAIGAIVVRSANDVAVVLAENLGKTEWDFAVMMTAKARTLGMSHTVYRNASGLPDNRQLTTARDQAVLGIALRRDFPEYYPYFNTRAFVYKKVTYTTHNRVLQRLPGADGIKTGYIGASGFNLVTSVRQNGHNLVGVVFGGDTAARRDTQMIALLKDGFTLLASGKAPAKSTQLASAAATGTVVPPPRSNPWRGFETASNTAVLHDAVTDAGVPAPTANPLRSKESYLNKVSFTNSAKAPIDNARQWGVQVGAFGDSRQALVAATHAITLAENELSNSRIAVTEANDTSSSIHRARLADLTEQQARNACKKLATHKESCFVYQLSAAEPEL